MIILKPKSEKFFLRHFVANDVKGFYECQQDKWAKKGFMTVPKNLAAAKKEVKYEISQYKKKKPTGESFAIVIDGNFAGYVEVHDLNKKFREHKAKIGYCLHEKFRGQGITADAVKLITKYAFKKYKLKRIAGWCRTFNKASASVLNAQDSNSKVF